MSKRGPATGRPPPTASSSGRGQSPTIAPPPAAAAPPKTAATPTPRGLRRWTSLSAKKLLAACGALIALLVSMTTLVDWVTKQLKKPPAATIDTRILAADHQGPQQLGAYLADTNRSTRGYDPVQLRQLGIVFALRIKLVGEKGQIFPLRWYIVDAEAGERLPGRSYNQEPAIFRPRNNNHTRTWPIWVPYPPKPGVFRVTFVLNDAKHEPVDQRTTQPFQTPGAQKGA